MDSYGVVPERGLEAEETGRVHCIPGVDGDVVEFDLVVNDLVLLAHDLELDRLQYADDDGEDHDHYHGEPHVESSAVGVEVDFIISKLLVSVSVQVRDRSGLRICELEEDISLLLIPDGLLQVFVYLLV